MVTVSHQCDLFLCGHREERIDHVMRLLAASPLLDSLVGPEILTPGRDEPRYRNDDELASEWLAHDEHSSEGHRVEELIRGDGDIGTRLAHEIIERGPLHGFDSEDVWSPLDLLLRFHGPEAIDAIEAAAAESIALRRVIWVSRRQAPDADDPYAVEAQRAVAMLLSGCRDGEVERDVTVLLSQCEVADTTLSRLKESIPEAELHFLIYRGIDVPTDPASPLTVRYHREQEIAFVSDEVGRVVAVIGREATRTLFGE